MHTIDVKGNPRTATGKKAAKALRKEKNVPCELYGGKENIHFSATELELRKLTHTPNTYLVNLDVDGKKHKAVLRETQFHPITDQIIHADFEAVQENKDLKVELPVLTTGKSEGVIAGGKLTLNMRKIAVKGSVDKIPTEITLDISPLNIGDSIRIKDIDIEGVTLTQPESNVVVAVRTTRVVLLEEDLVEGAEGAEGTEGAEGAEGTPAQGAPAEAAK